MSMVHPMARTTPRTRAEIHDSAASVAELAQAYNISSSTARKWRNRDDLLDRSHKAHQLHTTLSPAQELIVMEIRRLCLLPLDDLVAVTKQFINADASRSGVSRLLRREGLSKLSDLEPRVEGEETSRKTFKDYEPGFVHIDIKFLPKMPDEAQHSYLFVAIDRATRWVFMRIYADQTQGSAVDFLRRVHEAAAFKITKLLTDNGTQFTDRFTSKNKQASGRHSFDRQCKALEIEHRLSPPRRPQTNGMVERFNGRISEVIKQTRFASAAELASTLNNYWQAYNHHIPQRALGHVSPVDSLKNWHQKKPELFRKRIYKQAELDNYEKHHASCVRSPADDQPGRTHGGHMGHQGQGRQQRHPAHRHMQGRGQPGGCAPRPQLQPAVGQGREPYQHQGRDVVPVARRTQRKQGELPAMNRWIAAWSSRSAHCLARPSGSAWYRVDAPYSSAMVAPNTSTPQMAAGCAAGADCSSCGTARQAPTSAAPCSALLATSSCRSCGRSLMAILLGQR